MTLLTRRRAIRALFAANRRSAALVATLEDGSTAVISARPASVTWTDHLGTAGVTIVLTAYNDWTVTAPTGRAFESTAFESTAFAVGA